MSEKPTQDYLQGGSPFSIQRIGIALAAYRPEPEIFAAQLGSIVRQTWSNWICIVTMDSPLEELESDPYLVPYFKNSRFRWIENEVRLGHKSNFSKGIELLSQMPEIDAIACSDQDDVWLPHKLVTLAKALEPVGSLALVHSDMRLIFGKELSPEQSTLLGPTLWEAERRGVLNVAPLHLAVRSLVNGASMMFGAELARRFPRIPEGVDYHDQWYAFLAALHGGVNPVFEPLVCYRQHGANVVGASAFQGRFSLPAGGRVRGVRALIGHFQSRWGETERILAAAAKLGLRVPRVGLLGLVSTLVRYVWSDPVLARASGGRLIGAVISWVFPSRENERVG